MKRRTKIVLLVAGLAVAAPVASVVVLTKALAMAVRAQHYCDSGFSTLVDCHYRLSTKTVSQRGQHLSFCQASRPNNLAVLINLAAVQ